MNKPYIFFYYCFISLFFITNIALAQPTPQLSKSINSKDEKFDYDAPMLIENQLEETENLGDDNKVFDLQEIPSLDSKISQTDWNKQPIQTKKLKKRTFDQLASQQTVFDLLDANEYFIQKHKLIAPDFTPSIYDAFAKDSIPTYSDEVYRNRLNELDAKIPMTFNPEVKKFIELYLVDKREQVSRMLSKSSLYFPIFESALNRYGLPMELKYLPIIQSALIPHFQSKSGKSGLWQLSVEVAKLNGLEVSNTVDERRDPKLSTEVAVRNLLKLYTKYKNWHLAIAAYCAGTGNIEKAIKRAATDIKGDYWEVARFLPKDKQYQVPLFIAANYVMQHYADHNLKSQNVAFTFYTTDTIMVNQAMSLKKIAQFVSMPEEELYFLNPALVEQRIIKTKKGYPLTLPTNKIGLFEVYLRNLNSSKIDVIYEEKTAYTVDIEEDNPWQFEMTNFNIITKENEAEMVAAKKTVSTQQELENIIPEKIIYNVKKGEVLSSIAKRYNCSTQQIQRWNRLKKGATILREGLPLIIYLLPDKNDPISQKVVARGNKIFKKNKEVKKFKIFKAKKNPINNDSISPNIIGDTILKLALEPNDKTKTTPLPKAKSSFGKEIPKISEDQTITYPNSTVQADKVIFHTVTKEEISGELEGIAKKYKIQTMDILNRNEVQSITLEEGMVIKIPVYYKERKISVW